MAENSQFTLQNRMAMITGGGSGIGQQIAHALSDVGAAIVLVGRREAQLSTVLGQRAGSIIPLDLSEEGAAEAARDACDKVGVQPDILVNAAGINLRKSADTTSLDDWNSTLHLNLSVPFLLAQQLVPAMKQQKWGRIINIASLQSVRAFTNGIAYGASKGGVMQLTRAMAEAWSSDGINANAIAPGFFPTALTGPVFADEDIAAHHARQTAVGRNGMLSDLDGPAVFLASEAARYVTGQTLFVDGGYTAK
jgi:NAD(P)-dependent dehydrogenase (short-subunit alcohol dehydrogenase family)